MPDKKEKPEDYGIKNYEFDGDILNVADSVYLSWKGFEKLPFKFGIVTGDFHCFNNHLTTLEGSPQKVGEDFYCSGNQLTTLEGSPVKVHLWK